MIVPTFTVCNIADLDGTPTGTDITDQLDAGDCQVRLNEEGKGGVIVPYGETITPDPIGKAVVIAFDGTVAATLIVEGRRDVEVDPGEEARMVTEYYGRLSGSLLDRYRWRPTLGPDRSPWALSRPFGPLSPEFDISGWGAATEYVQVGATSFGWTGMPQGFPALDVTWIGPSEGDDEAGPYGYWWAGKDFTISTAGPYVFFFGIDDFGVPALDGFSLGTINTDRDPTSGYRSAHVFAVYLDVGTHRFAVKGVNNFGVGDPGYGEGATVAGNPTGFCLVGYATDGAGRLGTRVLESDSTWKMLSYPTSAPGFTDPEVVDICVSEAIAAGVDPSFTVVPHGTFTPQETITVRVGSSLLAHLKNRADGDWIDWAVPPEGKELHIWPAGERGTASGVTYSTANGNLQRLVATQLDVNITGLWVAYAGGWVFVGTGGRPGVLETRAATVGEAKALAEAILARDPQPEQVTLDIAPDAGEVPGVDVLDGDTVTAGSFVERVIGWSMDWSDANSGEPRFDLDLKDRIRGDEERIALMVARAAPGQLGGSAPASPAADPPEFGSKIRSDELTWNVEKPDGDAYLTGEAPSDKIPSSSGNLYAVRASAKALTSGTATVVYKVDGTTVATCSLTSGALVTTVQVDPIVWLEGGVTRTTIEITAVGTGLEGLSVEALVV